MQTPVHCNDPVCATGTNNSQVMIDFGNQSLRSMTCTQLRMDLHKSINWRHQACTRLKQGMLASGGPSSSSPALSRPTGSGPAQASTSQPAVSTTAGSTDRLGGKPQAGLDSLGLRSKSQQRIATADQVRLHDVNVL